MFCETGREGGQILRWLPHLTRLQVLFRRVSPLLRNTLLITLATCILIAGVSLSWPHSHEAVTVFAPKQGGALSEERGHNNILVGLLQWLPLDYREVLSHGFPLLSYHNDSGESPQAAATSFWERFVGKLTRIDVSDPRSILTGQVPFFSQVGMSEQDREDLPLRDRSEVATVNPTPSPSRRDSPASSEGKPRVAIFHTHTSETFLPLHGVTHTYDLISGIVLAGQVLGQKLEERGIPIIHDRTPHDFQVHREAYSNAVATVASILQENSALELIIDLHRDAPNTSAAESRSITTTRVEGKDVAGILLVVGTDGLGLEHPDWEKNHMLALQIHQQMENMYPGLSRGVRTSRARYNQHLSPRMILVELGGVENNMGEVYLAVEYLAAVLAAMLQ